MCVSKRESVCGEDKFERWEAKKLLDCRMKNQEDPKFLGSGVMSGTAVKIEFFQKLGFGDANL